MGMEIGRVLFFFLPDKWSVMWKRSALYVDGHIVVLCLQEEFVYLLAVVDEEEIQNKNG